MGHRLVTNLERLGEQEARSQSAGTPQPKGVNLLDIHTCRRESLLGGIDREVADRLVPLLAKPSTAHAHNGNTIANSVTTHLLLLQVFCSMGFSAFSLARVTRRMRSEATYLSRSCLQCSSARVHLWRGSVSLDRY